MSRRRKQQRRTALWVMELRVRIEQVWASVRLVRDEASGDPELQALFTDWRGLSRLSLALEEADSAATGLVLNGLPGTSEVAHPLPPLKKGGA